MKLSEGGIMAYISTVNTIFSIIFTITGLFYAHFVIFAIAGLFFKKKFKKAKVQHTYGIVVAARNEEKVIGNLVKSIRSANYPQEKLKIFVIAHNCTDNTYQVCKDLGVNVFEYNNENEKTKGYALKYLFEQIKQNGLDEGIEGYHVFDADNLVGAEYFNKMNDAFEATDKQSIISSFRNSKNFGSNVISGLYGIYFMLGCKFEMLGRSVVGCSTRVSGTGYLFNKDVVKDGWNYVTLTEDWELTADQILQHHKIVYCDEAELFDEQPTSFKIMWRQRVRWSKGHLLVCTTRLKDLLKNLFTTNSRKQLKGSTYDYVANILPFCLILTFFTVLQLIVTLFAPAFTNVSFGFALLSWIKSFGLTCLTAYIGGLISAILVFVCERKRIYNVSFGKKILLTLIWPLFLGMQFIIDVVALFQKNLGWKTIPHEDNTAIEDLTKKTK